MCAGTSTGALLTAAVAGGIPRPTCSRSTPVAAKRLAVGFMYN